VNPYVKYRVFSQVYTIIAFGVSILLLIFPPPIPLFSLRNTTLSNAPFFLSLSTAIVWVTAIPISLYDTRKRRVSLSNSVGNNFFYILLALATVIVAMSGSIFWFKTVIPSVEPPRPFAVVYGFGVIFIEEAWIIAALYSLVKGLKAQRKLKRLQEDSIGEPLLFCLA